MTDTPANGSAESHDERLTIHDPSTDPACGLSADQAAAEVREAYTKLKNEIHKVIVGQDEVVDQILTCVFSRGHALVVGVPGLAKTLP